MPLFSFDPFQSARDRVPPAPIVRPARRPPLPQSMVGAVCAIGEFYYRQQEYGRALAEFQALVESDIRRAAPRTRRRVLRLWALAALRAFDAGVIARPPLSIALRIAEHGELSLARVYLRLARSSCLKASPESTPGIYCEAVDRMMVRIAAFRAARTPSAWQNR